MGKARDELAIGAIGGFEYRRGLELTQGRDLDQLTGNLTQALTELGLARLPADPAEAVELSVRLVGAITRQKLDVLHRQIELVAARVIDFEAVVGCAQRLDGLESDEAADAVIRMYDEIARREAGRFGDDIGSAARTLLRAHKPIAENVLLCDDGEIGSLEAAFEAERREERRRLRQYEAFSEIGNARRLGEPVLG